jgi:hypothetical protein
MWKKCKKPLFFGILPLPDTEVYVLRPTIWFTYARFGVVGLWDRVIGTLFDWWIGPFIQ